MAPKRNFLLINPWIHDFTAYDLWARPLGLLYIAAILEKAFPCRVDLIDCLDRAHPALSRVLRSRPDGRGPLPKEEIPKPPVLADIPRRFSRYGIPVALFREALGRVPPPDIVFVTGAMTYWYPGVQEAIGLVRESFGRVPVVLGGAYATLMPDHSRRHSGADIVIEGPGENRVLSLVREVLGDSPAEAGSYPTLDRMPRPAFDLLGDRTCLPILTSRGCPYRCSFCAGRRLFDGFEQRAPESVFDEIADGAGRLGARHFAFYDDALLTNKAGHLAPVLEAVVDSGLPVSFHAPNGVHVREVDPGFARLLRRAGMTSLFLSQESLDAELLEARAPKVVPGDLERALSALEGGGYPRSDIGVYLIAGLPGQRAETVREAVRRVLELGAVPRLAHYSPIPGTPDWESLVRDGALSADADPLLHNKTVGPWLWGSLSPDDLAEIREDIAKARDGRAAPPPARRDRHVVQ
jgi:Radical SAM superfamily/B12 binding domain